MTRQLCFKQSSNYPFDLNKVLYAGQDFRWCIWKDDWHSGVLDGNLIHIRQVGDVLEYKSHSGYDLDEMLRSYFRLEDPIDKIYDDVSRRDAKVNKLVKKYPWLRVLRQPDPWECMVAYICSARASVPKIRKNVDAIAKKLGSQIELCGDVRYTFPSCEEVLDASVGALEELHLGLPRIPGYIMDAAKRVCCGDLDFEELAGRPYTETIRELKDLDGPSNGIGNKTSNCIALFALEEPMAFPVDRNIGRALTEWYDDCPMPKDLSRLTDKRYDKHYTAIVCWAWERFGKKNAGYANQFLFFEEWQGDEPIFSTPCDGRDSEGSSRLF